MLIGIGLLAFLFALGFFIKNHLALVLIGVFSSGLIIHGSMHNPQFTAVKGVLYLLVPLCALYAGRGIGAFVKRPKAA